jgi:hypothetical protein
MSSKPSLSALMKRAAHGPSAETVVETPTQALTPAPAPALALVPTPAAPAPQTEPVMAATQPNATPRAPTRGGKAPLSVWVTPEARRTLRQLAAEHDRTIESLMAEGLNDLFQKHQKPRLA